MSLAGYDVGIVDGATGERPTDPDEFIVRADGSGLMNVTDSPARDSDALWVPGR